MLELELVAILAQAQAQAFQPSGAGQDTGGQILFFVPKLPVCNECGEEKDGKEGRVSGRCWAHPWRFARGAQGKSNVRC